MTRRSATLRGLFEDSFQGLNVDRLCQMRVESCLQAAANVPFHPVTTKGDSTAGRPHLAQFSEQFVPAPIGQAEIGKHEIKGKRLRANQSFLDILRRGHFMTAL